MTEVGRKAGVTAGVKETELKAERDNGNSTMKLARHTGTLEHD